MKVTSLPLALVYLLAFSHRLEAANVFSCNLSEYVAVNDKGRLDTSDPLGEQFWAAFTIDTATGILRHSLPGDLSKPEQWVIRQRASAAWDFVADADEESNRATLLVRTWKLPVVFAVLDRGGPSIASIFSGSCEAVR